jgi:hypothetical protein
MSSAAPPCLAGNGSPSIRTKPREASDGASSHAMKTKNTTHAARPATALVACSISFAIVALGVIAVSIQHSSRARPGAEPVTLAELLRLSPVSLREVPIAQMNLLCARGLCATNEPDLKECLATLAAWAEHVRSETTRHQYRFERNPAEFENSPGFYRMLILSVVLIEDYEVHYDTQRKAGPLSTQMDDGFFAEPRSLFLHGLLGPERIGTCSSLPVLYVAVGRQLGYPLKLVTTKGHLFVRWEGEGERFNVEATGHGLNRFDDDYYRHWPFELGAEEEKAAGYLQSLTPSEELAAFLSVRGMCLREQGRFAEATDTFAAAARLAPGCRDYAMVLASLQSTLGDKRRDRDLTTKTPGQTARN